MLRFTDLTGRCVDKVQTAIDRLKAFEPEDGYYLAFSGGKDSVCIKELAVMAGVKFDAHYSVTTVDPPELTRFILKHHPDVIWDSLNAKRNGGIYAWKKNPWVWVYEFERIAKEDAE